MPAKRRLLNVRSLLERIAGLRQGLDRYGYCPAIQLELRQMEVLARAILLKSVAKGRKDVYVERGNGHGVPDPR